MKLKTTVISLAALAGVSALAPGEASAMPNGLPHTERPSGIDQVRWTLGDDAGGDRIIMGLTAITGVQDFMVGRGDTDTAGTADGVVGNPRSAKAGLRGLRASFFQSWPPS